jgi:acetyl esterase/lipase
VTSAERDAALAHLTTEATFEQIAQHPAFTGFGRFMVPWEAGPNVQLTRSIPIGTLVPLIGPWDPSTILGGLNFLIDQVAAGNPLWHPLYRPDERRADATKDSAGLFWIPGRALAPLALVAAGGGFTSVASMQEAFPHARALNAHGYNVAILKYRVSADGADDVNMRLPRALEDVAAALFLLQQRGEEWMVSLTGYSMWGSSAGGRLACHWGSPASTGAAARGFTPPAALITAYPGPAAELPGPLAPLFTVMAMDDELIPVDEVDDFIARLEREGTPVDYRRVPTGRHGFGLGIGTSAAGWLDDAVSFWERHRGPGPQPGSAR